jgi:hypothetical protein
VKEAMLKGLHENLESYEQIHALELPNEVAPALVFDPVPAGARFETERRPLRMSRIADPCGAEQTSRTSPSTPSGSLPSWCAPGACPRSTSRRCTSRG